MSAAGEKEKTAEKAENIKVEVEVSLDENNNKDDKSEVSGDDTSVSTVHNPLF